MNKFWRYFKIVTINLFLFLLIIEVLLHLVPLKITEYHSSFQYSSDADVGYLPLGGQTASHNLSCLSNTNIRTNSLGMRGSEWKSVGNCKIALLGDSFLHALTVPDQLHVSTLLSTSTNALIWNGGVSGYGTYQELLLWKKLMKPRKPDITIVFLYLENDIRDNQCQLCKDEGQVYSPCCEMEGGRVVEKKDFEIRKPAGSSLKEWFKKNYFTFRAISNLIKPDNKNTESKNYFDINSFAYNVYRPQLSNEWVEGWKVTAWSLKELKRECDAIGSKLLIVNVPGVIQLSHDWKAEMKSQLGSDEIPHDFDINYPIHQLNEIVDSIGVNFLDLQPEFIAYRDKYQLPHPVFGWCCDGHWNPLGHQLAADLIQNYLLEIGWKTGYSRIVTPDPIKVLGNDLYRKIYNCEMIEF